MYLCFVTKNEKMLRAVYDFTLYEVMSVTGKKSIQTIKKIEEILKDLNVKTNIDTAYRQCLDRAVNGSNIINEDEVAKFWITLTDKVLLANTSSFNVFLKKSKLFNDIVSELLADRGLYGDLAEDAKENALNQFSNSFDIQYFNDKEHTTSLKMVRSFFDIQQNIKSEVRTLGGTLLKGEDGEYFDVAIDTIEVESSQSKFLFKDSKFYVENMTKLQLGSNILFQSSGGSRSNLEESFSSIANRFKREDLKMLALKVASTIPQAKNINFILPKEAEEPLVYLKKNDSTAVNNWRGHLSFKYGESINGYHKRGIGHQDTHNKIMKRGNSILDVCLRILRGKHQGVINLYYEVSRTLEKELEVHLGPDEVVAILEGIVATNSIQKVLYENSLTMGSFPCVELRQSTWNRFSNLYELMNFTKVHEIRTVNEKLNIPTSDLNGQELEIIKIISATNTRSDHDEYVKNILDKNLKDPPKRLPNSALLRGFKLSTIDNTTKKVIERSKELLKFNTVQTIGIEKSLCNMTVYVFLMLRAFLMLDKDTLEFKDDLKIVSPPYKGYQDNIRMKMLMCLKELKRVLQGTPVLSTLENNFMEFDNVIFCGGIPDYNLMLDKAKVILDYNFAILENMDKNASSLGEVPLMEMKSKFKNKNILVNAINILLYFKLNEVKHKLKRSLDNINIKIDECIESKKSFPDPLILFNDLISKGFLEEKMKRGIERYCEDTAFELTLDIEKSTEASFFDYVNISVRFVSDKNKNLMSDITDTLKLIESHIVSNKFVYLEKNFKMLKDVNQESNLQRITREFDKDMYQGTNSNLDRFLKVNQVEWDKLLTYLELHVINSTSCIIGTPERGPLYVTSEELENANSGANIVLGKADKVDTYVCSIYGTMMCVSSEGYMIQQMTVPELKYLMTKLGGI